MTNGARVAIGIALIAAFAAVAVLLPRAEPSERPDVYKLEKDGLRFTYHVISGTRGLFDLANDPKCLRNLAPERPADAQRLEDALERKLGVRDLAETREASRDAIERWHQLGYF